MSSIKIAILTPSKNSYTETFIHNHIAYLPFDKIVIYGDEIPYKLKDADTYHVRKSFLNRLWARALNITREK
jgi:hypothetical protein